MFYPAKTPKWVQKLFPGSLWTMPGKEKTLYLTFDDGPHPELTPFVLDALGKYGAKATFFCIGRNVQDNPGLYRRILEEGHAVGNHSFSHLNGWRTGHGRYLADVLRARGYIDSGLFRPPYGRITWAQRKELGAQDPPFKVIMWSILSGDFDTRISPQRCCSNVIRNAKSGAVIVFHDSDKAAERLRYSLPIVLKHFSGIGYSFKEIIL